MVGRGRAAFDSATVLAQYYKALCEQWFAPSAMPTLKRRFDVYQSVSIFWHGDGAALSECAELSTTFSAAAAALAAV